MHQSANNGSNDGVATGRVGAPPGFKEICEFSVTVPDLYRNHEVINHFTDKYRDHFKVWGPYNNDVFFSDGPVVFHPRARFRGLLVGINQYKTPSSEECWQVYLHYGAVSAGAQGFVLAFGQLTKRHIEELTGKTVISMREKRYLPEIDGVVRIPSIVVRPKNELHWTTAPYAGNCNSNYILFMLIPVVDKE